MHFADLKEGLEIIYIKRFFKAGVRIQDSNKISPRIQQSLLHWSYKVNNGDYEKWKLDNEKRI